SVVRWMLREWRVGGGCQRVGAARLLDVDGLHTARPDVEAEDFRRLAEERHIKRLSPCWLCSIGRPTSGGPIISHLLHSGAYRPPAPRPWNAPGTAPLSRPRPLPPSEGACRRKFGTAGSSGRVLRTLARARSSRSLV